MYIYPENLKAKPMLWLWLLRDIAIIGVAALIDLSGSVCLHTDASVIPVRIIPRGKHRFPAIYINFKQ